MKQAAFYLILAYGGMLLAVGLAGIFVAPWELDVIFSVNADATLLNQYRFLKAVEMGAGLFCLVYSKDILQRGRHATVFLALVAGGVFARSYAWLVDGRPAGMFLVFLLLEVLVLIVVAIQVCGARHGL